MYDSNNFYLFISVDMRLANLHCVVPENFHTYPKEDYWKFQGEGGGGGHKKDFYRGSGGGGLSPFLDGA